MFALVPTPVQGQATPMLCWGVVTLDDAPAPEGTIVEIYIGDDIIPTANTTVSTHNGTDPPGTYGAVPIRADESRYGELLNYTVNGSPATKDGPDEGVFGLENQVVNLEAFSGPQLRVTTEGSEAVTDITATLKGNLVDMGNCTGEVNVWFEYDSVTSDELSLSVIGPFSIPIDGLINGTTYSFKAKAVTVTPCDIVTDEGISKSFTTLNVSPTPTPTPTIVPPKLTSITWSDVDQSGTINKGDLLRFNFSKAMDTGTITAHNVNTRLPTNPEHFYGTITSDNIGWSNSDTRLTVVLAEDETIVGGETVNPTSLVTDNEGNSDATPGAGPAIPTTTTPTPTPTPTTTPTPTLTPTTTPTPTPTPTPPPFEGNGTVGVSGGTVTTNDSKVSLDFPAGAFTSNTTVTIKSASCRTAPEGYTVQNTCFSITTSPSVANLSASATIQVKYSTADWNAAGKEPDRLKLAYYSGGEWNLLVTTVSTASGTVSAQTDHLSDWAVLAKEAGSAWQWWYTLLIVMGVLIIIAAVVLFVVIRGRGSADDFDDDDLYIDDEEF
jgi:hypothetical protein